jgi:hypothetical protein
VIVFRAQNQDPIAEGTRVTVTLRKFRPRYALVSVNRI